MHSCCIALVKIDVLLHPDDTSMRGQVRADARPGRKYAGLTRPPRCNSPVAPLRLTPLMLIANSKAVASHYPLDLKHVMNRERAEESLAWLSHWSELCAQPTPLHELPDLAESLGIARLSVKDESVRSPLGSFKALGAPIALIRLILRRWPEQQFSTAGLITGQYSEQLKDYTVISATDGNHGRALAAAARSIGCQCVILLHANVSHEREAAIAVYGAKIARIAGNYDESVAEAARVAAANGWDVVSDTSYEGYQEIPRDVMQGYGAIAAEVLAQNPLSESHSAPYTHVFLQGGVGGLAAGIISYFWEAHGAHRPQFVVVEPEQADCLFQSARLGQPARASGSVDSVMAGLACGEASPLAWKFLHGSVDYFMTIEDDDAVHAMRMLAKPSGSRDVPIVSGESGVAGLAGLIALSKHPEGKTLLRKIGLNASSRILVVSTEGATAPLAYQELVGVSADFVLQAQREWFARNTENVPL